MNGQLYHLIKVIDISNKAISGLSTEYKEYEYTGSVTFQSETSIVSKSIAEWCKYLKHSNCKRVYTKLLVDKQDRNLSAFANGASSQFMICLYDGYYEIWQNSFAFKDKNWDVCYHMLQKVNENFVLEKYDYKRFFHNLIESYKKIGDFALEINEESWAKFFYSGKAALEELEKNDNYDVDMLISSIKWPFGGMGSWNDSPPYSAYQLGKEEEFNTVSDNLYKSINEAIEAMLNSALF